VASYRGFAAAAVVLPWTMQSAQAASFTFKNIADARAASLPFMRFISKVTNSHSKTGRMMLLLTCTPRQVRDRKDYHGCFGF
jgi:hypothetical protein